MEKEFYFFTKKAMEKKTIEKAFQLWKERKEKQLKNKFKLEKELKAWKNFLKAISKIEIDLKKEKTIQFKEKEKQLKKALKNPWKTISSYTYNLYNSRPGKTNLYYKRLEKEILFWKWISHREKLENIARLENEKREKLEKKNFFKSRENEKNFLLYNVNRKGKGKKLEKLISRLEYKERKKKKLFEKLES